MEKLYEISDLYSEDRRMREEDLTIGGYEAERAYSKRREVSLEREAARHLYRVSYSKGWFPQENMGVYRRLMAAHGLTEITIAGNKKKLERLTSSEINAWLKDLVEEAKDISPTDFS